MAEPLKDLYNKKLIETLADEIKKNYGGFKVEGFARAVFSKDWKDKELKERMRFIAETLAVFLPKNYERALKILMPASTSFKGFEYMFFPDFVELYGLGNFELSMKALEHFTEFSSSEFAVRPFIKEYPDKTMTQMGKWADSENEHIRRLASEGCRPRLPWAMALPEFKKDPKQCLKIIRKLLSDESEYVRRSAANNLNDISKDRPDEVIKFTKKYIGNSKNTDRLLKHGCRTLLKAGNTEVLAIFGFSEANHVQIKSFEAETKTAIGQHLNFSFSIRTAKKTLGRLRLEYAVDYKKKNGKQLRKIFKISEGDFSCREKIITKSHSFKDVSTRKHYGGVHGLAIIINGREAARHDFLLTEKD